INQFLVWDASSAQWLRQARVLAVLVGTLPRCPRQNRCLYLPCALTAEQAAVAAEELQSDIRFSCQTACPDHPADSATIAEYARQREQNYSEATEVLLARRRLRMTPHAAKIAAGRAVKRRRQEQKMEHQTGSNKLKEQKTEVEAKQQTVSKMEVKESHKLLETKPEVEGNQMLGVEAKPEVEGNQMLGVEAKPEVEGNQLLGVEAKPEVEENQMLGVEAKPEVEENQTAIEELEVDLEAEALAEGLPTLDRVPIHLPTRTPDSWLRRGELLPHDCGAAPSSPPETARNRLRLNVWRQLWRLGYYLTSGAANFGADFLLYQGEPLRYHATHLVLCCPSGSLPPPRSLTCHLRVANDAKKLLLIALPVDNGAGVAFRVFAWRRGEAVELELGSEQERDALDAMEAAAAAAATDGRLNEMDCDDEEEDL
ncbi:hypothetical protein BOX15_Mlig028031g1, partial [Macrostomum lignano]